jgi:sulfide:quinone oxidoreductase
VTFASGRTHGYRDLVLCAGLVPDDEALPGIAEALRSPAVASNYLDHAEKTWDLMREMRSGHAVFTVPRPPVSCTGTTIKPLFLAAAHWKRTRRLGDIDITLVVDRAGLVDVPDLDERLNRCLDELNVRVLHRTSVAAVDPERSELTLTGPDGTAQTMSYDALHLVPPFRGPTWLADSRLTDPDRHGVVDVDPRTFRHRTQPDIWAVGDGAGVDTDPSGGALRRQVKILVDNVLGARHGGRLSEYDGYTVAPVATDAHHLIAGEFDRSAAVSSSLPSFLDPLKPRRAAWAFDRYGLPQTYWNLILKGRV